VYTQYVASALAPHETPENAGALQALVNLLGNCQLPLSHRAPVTITASPESNQRLYIDPLFQDGGDNITNPVYSTLTVNNPYSIFVDGDDPYIDNGVTQWGWGTAWWQYLVVFQQYVNRARIKNLKIEKLEKDGYTFEDVQVLKDVNVSFSFDPNTCEGTVTVEKFFVKIKTLVQEADADTGDEPQEDGPNGSQNQPGAPEFVMTGGDGAVPGPSDVPTGPADAATDSAPGPNSTLPVPGDIQLPDTPLPFDPNYREPGYRDLTDQQQQRTDEDD
jgi:hypothetical protein